MRLSIHLPLRGQLFVNAAKGFSVDEDVNFAATELQLLVQSFQPLHLIARRRLQSG